MIDTMRRMPVVFAAVLIGATAAVSAQPPALKDLMPPGILVGVALSKAQVEGRDAVALALVTRHFDSVSPENLLKWESVHPQPGRYDFEAADRYVAFAERRGMAAIGHTLVWHQQTPAWVFAGPGGGRADRDTLLARLREHIHTVVGRYRGRIKGWDVVNEAVSDDAEGSLRKTGWLEGIGPDYLAKAFQYAHEADPQAELYYNDYSLTRPAKRAAALRLVRELRAAGLRVDAVGEQGHWLLEEPALADIDATLADIAAAGVKAMVTELDVDVLPRDPAMYGADLDRKARYRAQTNLYPAGLPEEKQRQLAQRYADLFALFVKHRQHLSRVTFWGVSDGHTWLDNFPVPGRVNYPLLFDRQGRPKPAFDAVVAVLERARRPAP